MYTGLTFLDHLVCCFKNVYTSQQTFHDSTVHRRRRYRRTTTSKQAIQAMLGFSVMWTGVSRVALSSDM